MKARLDDPRADPGADLGGRDESAASPDLAAARRVLSTESRSLAALAETLDEAFVAAIARLHAVTGRIVVTGMGKSGHIARKIASTLASTGSPAHFVHPGEASHGDLGMITPKDAVLALSNSGATTELDAIVTYSRRYGIPLVAMTAGAGSALAEQADVALILPAAPEACPMGLAPTTSTTMMLGLGDAIAIALLERRGFSAQDFQVLHPGGNLGQKLLRVADLMHGANELPVCTPETPMAEAILVMTNKRFGCVGVVDGSGALVGIVTDGDLRRHMAPDLLKQSAGQVMTPGPKKTIRPQALAAEAVNLMNADQPMVTSLFVVEEAASGGARPVGIIHIHDCLRAGVS